mgnify:CR=1 FL=1
MQENKKKTFFFSPSIIKIENKKNFLLLKMDLNEYFECFKINDNDIDYNQYTISDKRKIILNNKYYELLDLIKQYMNFVVKYFYYKSNGVEFPFSLDLDLDEEYYEKQLKKFKKHKHYYIKERKIDNLIKCLKGNLKHYNCEDENIDFFNIILLTRYEGVKLECIDFDEDYNPIFEEVDVDKYSYVSSEKNFIIITIINLVLKMNRNRKKSARK